MTVNDMPLHNVPCHRVHAIYKFDKSFYAFYNNMGMNTRYMKSVVGCPGVKINYNNFTDFTPNYCTTIICTFTFNRTILKKILYPKMLQALLGLRGFKFVHG